MRDDNGKVGQMSDDKLAFLDEPTTEQTPEPAIAAPEVTAPVEAQPEPEGDRARDPETGRFIPLTVLLDERDKRRDQNREMEELKQKLQKYEQPSDQPHEMPTDPREMVQTLVAEQQRMAFDERLNVSEMLARQTFGDDIVTAAQQAYRVAKQANPALQQALQEQLHPYKYVVEWHKQQKLLSEIGTDPEAWRKAETEKIRAAVLAELQGGGVPPPAQSSQQPPPSVVGRPAAAKTGTVPTGPGNAFDQTFR